MEQRAIQFTEQLRLCEREKRALQKQVELQKSLADAASRSLEEQQAGQQAGHKRMRDSMAAAWNRATEAEQQLVDCEMQVRLRDSELGKLRQEAEKLRHEKRSSAESSHPVGQRAVAGAAAGALPAEQGAAAGEAGPTAEIMLVGLYLCVWRSNQHFLFIPVCSRCGAGSGGRP